MVNYRLLKNDCLEEMKNLPDKSIDCIIVDPPYGTLGLHEWDKKLDWKEICKEIKRICTPKSAVLVFCDYKTIFNMQNEITSSGLKYRYFFTWNKHTANNMMSIKTMPLSQCEYILVFSCSGASPAYYTDAEPYESIAKLTKCIKRKRTSY